MPQELKVSFDGIDVTNEDQEIVISQGDNKIRFQSDNARDVRDALNLVSHHANRN